MEASENHKYKTIVEASAVCVCVACCQVRLDLHARTRAHPPLDDDPIARQQAALDDAHRMVFEGAHLDRLTHHPAVALDAPHELARSDCADSRLRPHTL